MERVKGIEPSSSAWKAVALPLSYTRAIRFSAATQGDNRLELLRLALQSTNFYQPCRCRSHLRDYDAEQVVSGGFEPPKTEVNRFTVCPL